MNKTAAYKIFGHGPKTVIILHGWGFNTEKSWSNFCQLCSKDQQFKWVFMYLPGLDFPLKSTSSTLEYAQYIQKVLKKHNLKTDFILAHSFGCKIATLLISKLQCSVKRAVFLGAAGLPYRLTVLERFKRMLSQLLSFLKAVPGMRQIGQRILSSKDYNQISDPKLKATFTKVISEDLSSDLQLIETPIHLVFGNKDTYTPLYMAYRMRDLLINAFLTIIRGANHGLHIHYPKKIYDLSRSYFLES